MAMQCNENNEMKVIRRNNGNENNGNESNNE